MSPEIHGLIEGPKVCPVCLSNAQARSKENPQKSLSQHYRDLVAESVHHFVVAPLPTENERP